MNLDRVTVTGADDSVSPLDLINLSQRFPWVEWGILLSKSSEGLARFPSYSWVMELLEVSKGSLRLSAHLCGSWVRDALTGTPSFGRERPYMHGHFQRIQLNFHAERLGGIYRHQLDRGLKQFKCEQFIFQFDGVNDALWTAALSIGYDVAPLFDLSGGAGLLPTEWPKPIAPYCGYAGGLSPANVVWQLAKIKDKVGNARIWIDVETHVRSADDARFDLGKVEAFLSRVEAFKKVENS